MNIDNIGKFTKTVFKYNDILVKHTVSLTNYTVDKGKEVYKSPVFEYDTMDKKIKEVKKNLYFTTSDTITISKISQYKNKIKDNNPIKTEENKEKDGYIILKPEDFRKTEETLNIGVDWLVKEEFAKLFTIDVQGNTVGLSNTKIASIARFPLSWLMIKPAVVFIKEVGYQSIYLKSDKGIIGAIPGEEYISFVNAMKSLMNNFYQCSLELYNIGLLTLLAKENK